jgi:hypothetical protein
VSIEKAKLIKKKAAEYKELACRAAQELIKCGVGR